MPKRLEQFLAILGHHHRVHGAGKLTLLELGALIVVAGGRKSDIQPAVPCRAGPFFEGDSPPVRRAVRRDAALHRDVAWLRFEALEVSGASRD
jgi:hypothetical protein